MKKWGFFLFVLTVFLTTAHNNALAFDSPLKVGWAIGYDENNAVILHTKSGGRKWVVQGKWASHGDSVKISAVDKQTVWATYVSADGDAIILHTTNGGVTWTEQLVHEERIYGLRGLTRNEAWAVTDPEGTVLHTTDGGETWNTVKSGLNLGNVKYINRMDAVGYRDVRDADRSGKNTGKIHANVWFTVNNGEYLGMAHTLYNGEIWRMEEIPFDEPGHGVHMLSAYSARVAWAAAWWDGNLYRTIDGGENWEAVAQAGSNDIDDMCAYSADALWLVQYQAGAPGIIYHVNLKNTDEPVVEFHPVDKNGEWLEYYYAGLACVDEQTALVVGQAYFSNTSPKGIILLTNDGGQTWERSPLPVDDVSLWKVSFVEARR